ncbi:hypothetical protein J8273_7647 [Carpediemonas membranifera]|uniref:Uncharacterized protein n=1 Tax=Carpediemonas membranifera TaxID=201153 RepID=A0A8J6AZY0_9EUKA|nr:hypothetical protein J8273_7647 [Carpediemonas membranifera]|eukprot:KAG9391279.1 hypothetical protein J8273_7647 [Carpediemonas membranifera]
MSQMRATLRWELQDALIFAPRDEENVNIILANVYRSLDPEFGRRAVGSAEGTGSKELARHTFSHIVHELVNSAIIDREEVDQAFLAINPRKFAGVVRSYTQQRFWTEAYVSRHREIARLQDRIAVLERTVANTERVMCLVNALRSVSEGVNSVSDSVVIFNNIASKLGCGEEVIRQSNNQLRLMSVDGDIRRLSGIEAILSEKQFDFLAPLVPTTLETGHNTFRYKDDKAYPLEQTLRFRASEDDIPLVRDSARSIGIDADVSVEGAFMTVFYNSVTARDAHIPHLKTLGFTLKKLTSATWQYVQEAHFDLRAHFEKLVAYPQAACLTVKERDAVSAALNQQRSHVDPDEQPRTIPLVLIVWFDAWKSQTTALKCRFYDPSGFVFPSILTPPFRVLEYQGKESDIRSHFSVVDQIIDMACKAVPKVRDTRHYCSIEKLILIADHPAMAKMIGTTCGGDYPSPFQPIHAANKGWSPFGVRYRLSLYDVVKAKQMVSDAEPGVDLTLEWGSFKAKKEKVIRPTMLASTEIPLSEVYISPPIMHISHDLIEQFGNIFKMFPSYTVEGRGEERVAIVRRNKMLQRAKNFEAPDRTTGCNEQVKGRKLMANLAKELYTAFPHRVQSVMRLAGYLQAHYYAMDPVTDEVAIWHRYAALVIHIFHLTLCLKVSAIDREDYRFPILRRAHVGDNAPCIQTIQANDRLVALPELQASLRIPFGRVIEEYFEREFISNQESRVHLRRNKVLGRLILLDQVNQIYRFMRGVVSHGRKNGNVPILSKLKTMRVHKCCKDVKKWLSIPRDLIVTTMSDADYSRLKPIFTVELEGLWKEVNRRAGLTFDDQFLVLPVHDDGVETLDICICR